MVPRSEVWGRVEKSGKVAVTGLLPDGGYLILSRSSVGHMAVSPYRGDGAPYRRAAWSVPLLSGYFTDDDLWDVLEGFRRQVPALMRDRQPGDSRDVDTYLAADDISKFVAAMAESSLLSGDEDFVGVITGWARQWFMVMMRDAVSEFDVDGACVDRFLSSAAVAVGVSDLKVARGTGGDTWLVGLLAGEPFMVQVRNFAAFMISKVTLNLLARTSVAIGDLEHGRKVAQKAGFDGVVWERAVFEETLTA